MRVIMVDAPHKRTNKVLVLSYTFAVMASEGIHNWDQSRYISVATSREDLRGVRRMWDANDGSDEWRNLLGEVAHLLAFA